MSIAAIVLIPLVLITLLALPLVPVWRGIATGKKAKRSILCNLCAFFGFVALMMLMPVSDYVAWAAAEEAVEVAVGVTTGAGLGYLAAALVTGMSAIGAGIAVASAAPAAIGATSEDPASFGKALIFVALGEGVALYGLLISILIINNL